MSASDVSRSVLPIPERAHVGTTSQNGHFNGKIKWVQLDAGVDDHVHLISDEERLRVAMAPQ